MPNTNDNTNRNNNSQSNSSNGRGFAGMDEDKQREIASMGGKAAHQSGNAHEFDSEEARRAGSRSHGGTSNNTDTSSNTNSNRSGSNR